MTQSVTRTENACLADVSSMLPRFKPCDWRQSDPGAGSVAGNNSLNAQIAKARREMGEARWQQLLKEWNDD